MHWRVGSCVLAIAIFSCAGVQQPESSSGQGDAARRRSLAMAGPPDAGMAFLFDKRGPGAASPRDVAARLGFARPYSDAMLALRGLASFAPADSAELRAHGFDDQGGVAV